MINRVLRTQETKYKNIFIIIKKYNFSQSLEICFSLVNEEYITINK